MAIYKCLASDSSINKAIEDIINPNKTTLIQYYGCMEETYLDEIQVCDMLSSGRGKREYGHHILSLPPNSPVTDEELMRVMEDYVKSQKLFQNRNVIVSIHTSKPHLHCHIVFQAVSHQGKKYQMTKHEMENMKEAVFNLLKERNIYY